MTHPWEDEADPCLAVEGRVFGDGSNQCFKMGFLDGELYYWWSDICYEVLINEGPYRCEAVGTTAILADDFWVDGSIFDLQTGLIDDQLHLIGELNANNVETWFPDR